MITIHLTDPHGERSALEFPDLTLTELFRKSRVVGDVVLLEPRPGVLVNLAHVELIYDSEAEGAVPAAETLDAEAMAAKLRAGEPVPMWRDGRWDQP